MAVPDITVRLKPRSGWAVMADGAEVGVYANWANAEARAARLRADAARQKRKCLCCNIPFISWGVGNRLCEVCRRRDNFDGAV